jgi:hypothetical protein
MRGASGGPRHLCDSAKARGEECGLSLGDGGSVSISVLRQG